MFYDLNVGWPSEDAFNSLTTTTTSTDSTTTNPKGAKGKQQQGKGKGKEKEKESQGIEIESSRQGSINDCFKGLNQRQKDELEAITQEILNLGYSVIAFNHQVQSKFIPNKHQNPFYSTKTQSSQPPFPQFDPRTSSSSASSSSSCPSSSSKLLQLSRLTLNLDSSSLKNNSHNLLSSSSNNALLSYDLLSVKPFDEASFSLVCLSLTELKPTSIDIISLDLSGNNRLPFFLKRSTVSKALENGAVFEVCYGETLGYSHGISIGDQAQNDKEMSKEEKNRRRRNVISCTRDLLRQTNGKGVILSSGVNDLLGFRGPNDVINLAYIFGMTPNAAKDSISSNCRSLIIRAQTRKTYRGLISDPKLVTRVSNPVFPKESMGDGIIEPSSMEKEKIPPSSTQEYNPKISEKKVKFHANDKEKEREKKQGISILSEREIPDPGLDMLGIGMEIEIGKRNERKGTGAISKNGEIVSKGKKRKLNDDEEEEEENDEDLEDDKETEEEETEGFGSGSRKSSSINTKISSTNQENVKNHVDQPKSNGVSTNSSPSIQQTEKKKGKDKNQPSRKDESNSPDQRKIKGGSQDEKQSEQEKKEEKKKKDDNGFSLQKLLERGPMGHLTKDYGESKGNASGAGEGEGKGKGQGNGEGEVKKKKKRRKISSTLE